jgi:Spy/CpxP family protein refolding chaperone
MSLSSYLSLQGRRHIIGALAAASLAGVIGHASAQTSPAAAGGRGGHEMGRMAERGIERMLKEVDGTPEQKAKLTQLAQAAQKEIQPLREQLMAARKKGMELLAAPTVDRAALEKLRSEQTQLMDTLSRRMLTHMADAAEVLTPAQRAKLAEKMKSRGDHGGRGGMRGHGSHGGGWFR